MTVKKHQIYTSQYLITDQAKFAEMMAKIDLLEKQGDFQSTGAIYDELFTTFPRQSRGVKVGNEVAVMNDQNEWELVTVTEENYKEVRRNCFLGAITHETWKVAIPDAVSAT